MNECGFSTHKSSAVSLAFLRRVSAVFFASSSFSLAASLAFAASFSPAFFASSNFSPAAALASEASFSPAFFASSNFSLAASLTLAASFSPALSASAKQKSCSNVLSWEQIGLTSFVFQCFHVLIDSLRGRFCGYFCICNTIINAINDFILRKIEKISIHPPLVRVHTFNFSPWFTASDALFLISS